MVIVIATIQVAAGQRERLLEHFMEVVPEVRSEEGCVEYGPAVDTETMIPAQGDVDPDKLVVFEKWETLEHLEQHLIAPHMIEYRGKVRDLIKSVDLQVLSPIQE